MGAATLPPPPPPGYSQPGYGQAPPSFNAAGVPSNIVSLLCYLVPVICPILFLVIDPYKNDRKIRFDAIQSLFLTGAYIVAEIIVGILAGISYHLSFLYTIIHLAHLGLILLLAFKAFQGEKFLLPVIGPLAEKQT